ncbi:MAG: DUF4097 family beta strand repeat-containing protein [Bacillota bacterium]|nr:DUF4097 family beta strand repeat-containing protein [Bacillota bacterium]
MNYSARNIIIPVIFMLLILSGCGRVITTEEFLQSYKVRSGTILEIFNPNGDVTVVGWDQDNVEIRAVKESTHGQSALEEVEIFIDIAETMTIRTDHPGQPTDVTVKYDIKIPADITVNHIECSNGNINLVGVTGNPWLATSNGTISAQEINGIVTARSSNGDISVIGARSLGGLSTSNGNIEAEVRLLHDDLEIRTSNGTITLHVAQSVEADFAAETSNGSITISNLNFDSVDLKQNSLVGVMNGGGNSIRLNTSNGAIDLLVLR